MVHADVDSTTRAAYAQKYYVRAQQHVAEGNWPAAMQELKAAIRCTAHRSEYHALLGVVYLNQKFSGMARVYIGQALKLNPHDPIARAYAPQVNLLTPPQPSPPLGKPNRWLHLAKLSQS